MKLIRARRSVGNPEASVSHSSADAVSLPPVVDRVRSHTRLIAFLVLNWKGTDTLWAPIGVPQGIQHNWLRDAQPTLGPPLPEQPAPYEVKLAPVWAPQAPASKAARAAVVKKRMNILVSSCLEMDDRRRQRR